MARKETESLKINRPAPKTYSKEELEKFDKLVQKYYEGFISPDGEAIQSINYEKLSTAFGATNDKGAVVLTNFGSETDSRGETTYWYDRPTRQEVFENLIKQWSWWKGSQDWAENKRIEALEEMAKQVSSEKSKIANDMEEVFNNF